MKTLGKQFLLFRKPLLFWMVYVLVIGISKLAVGHPGYTLSDTYTESKSNVVNQVVTGLNELTIDIFNGVNTFLNGTIVKSDNSLKLMHGAWNGAWLLGLLIPLLFMLPVFPSTIVHQVPLCSHWPMQ